ncbi:hypothetical protein [Ligilactobacillus equi]|nr:hypothetical protein [Ligilactobacillus equi]
MELKILLVFFGMVAPSVLLSLAFGYATMLSSKERRKENETSCNNKK